MRSIGILQILVSGFCFGFLGPFGKAAFSLGLTPGEFLSWRFLIASSALGAFFLARNPSALRIGAAPALRGLLLGACGYALFSSCFFLALRGLSVALTVLLLYTYPIWVTVGSRIFFHEKLTPRQWATLPVMLGGLLLLLWGDLEARQPVDLALGFLSSVFYAAYILASRKWLRDVPPLSGGFYVMAGAALVLGALHLRGMPGDLRLWGVLAGTSLLSTIAAICLFLAGLQKLSGAEASMLSLAEPVTGVLLGVALLRERLGALQWAGAFVVLAGLAVIASSPGAPASVSADGARVETDAEGADVEGP